MTDGKNVAGSSLLPWTSIQSGQCYHLDAITLRTRSQEIARNCSNRTTLEAKEARSTERCREGPQSSLPSGMHSSWLSLLLSCLWFVTVTYHLELIPHSRLDGVAKYSTMGLKSPKERNIVRQ